MPKAGSPRVRWLVFVITVIAVIVADQLTKAWIRSYPDGDVIFRRGFFQLVHFQNAGAAFGIFQQGSTVLMVVDFIAVALILAYMIFFAERVSFLRSKVTWVALSLIFAGTSGNLIDRLNHSVVGITDFLYFTYWPAFNVADSCITIGVVLLAFSLLFFQEKTESK